MSIEIVSGDDSSLKLTLKKDGIVYSIDPAATVKVALFDIRDNSLISQVVNASDQSEGADWQNGVVAVTFPSSDTVSYDQMAGVGVEVEVEESSQRQTWRGKGIKIVSGAIANT